MDLCYATCLQGGGEDGDRVWEGWPVIGCQERGLRLNLWFCAAVVVPLFCAAAVVPLSLRVLNVSYAGLSLLFFFAASPP